MHSVVWGKMQEVVHNFSELDEIELREMYGLYKDSRDWTVLGAQKDVLANSASPNLIKPIDYRPFEARYTFYTGKARGFLGTPSAPGSNQMVNETNRAIVSCRQQSVPGFQHVWISFRLTERCLISNRTREGCSIFLLKSVHKDPLTGFDDVLNIISVPVPGLPQPKDDVEGYSVFSYIYAILHSPRYRERYKSQSSKDFPKIPLPENPELFDEISAFRSSLIRLHIMQETILITYITTVVGSGNFDVEKVSYSDMTVWVDKARTRGFWGIPEKVWNFHVGSYQICEKWLKDRQAKGGKNPRRAHVLTERDIDHYQKIVVALSETIRIMAEIDEVIEAHGGWPGAFATRGNHDSGET